MFSTADTIVAIATPPGRGGIGVVRLSGPGSEAIARRMLRGTAPLVPRHASYSTLEAASGVTDHVVVTYFPAPRSYTGDDVVEISAHGSPVVLNEILREAMTRGARLAEPGEFTLRAFLNQKIDLAQAEAVVDLVESATPLQARAAFDQLNGTLSTAIDGIDAALFDLIARLEASVDFPEEGYHFVAPGELGSAIDGLRQQIQQLLATAQRGRVVREGRQIAIVGAPNAGKSSLFNAVVGAGRAIVSDVPGTTRDVVTEVVDLEGVRVTLLDTAGLRETENSIEAEGVSRSNQAIATADLVWVLVDVSMAPDTLQPFERLRGEGRRVMLVGTKGDLPSAWQHPEAITVSALTGSGLAELRRSSVFALGAGEGGDLPAVTNLRHVALLERADAALERAVDSARLEAVSEEFVLADLQDARSALEEVSGRRTSEDLLAHIFARFCIGK